MFKKQRLEFRAFETTKICEAGYQGGGTWTEKEPENMHKDPLESLVEFETSFV